MTNFDLLYRRAQEINTGKKLNDYASCGGVGSALISRNGNVYTGICIDTCSGLGFCAEHAAVAEMLKNNESEIAEVIAVGEDGTIMPPCGRCRELMIQVNLKNKNTLVYLPEGRSAKLTELLPEHWIP